MHRGDVDCWQECGCCTVSDRSLFSACVSCEADFAGHRAKMVGIKHVAKQGNDSYAPKVIGHFVDCD